MASSVVTLTKCGFGYSSLSETECNFYLKGSGERLLASFVNGVLAIFDNFVDCNTYDSSQSNWTRNDFLRTYLCKDTKIVFAEWENETSDYIKYLCVECTFKQAKEILQNFLDCYGVMQIVIENNFD